MAEGAFNSLWVAPVLLSTSFHVSLSGAETGLETCVFLVKLSAHPSWMAKMVPARVCVLVCLRQSSYDIGYILDGFAKGSSRMVISWQRHHLHVFCELMAYAVAY